MNLVTLLERNEEAIVAEATQSLTRSHLTHYEADGACEAAKRLKTLYELALRCLREKNAAPMTQYVEKVARERYASGFELFEVQTAFNVLEESIWRRILNELEPSKFAQAIGLISTVLGIGKDGLARSYVTLVSRTRAPSLDLKALFAGTSSGVTDSFLMSGADSP